MLIVPECGRETSFGLRSDAPKAANPPHLWPGSRSSLGGGAGPLAAGLREAKKEGGPDRPKANPDHPLLDPARGRSVTPYLKR